MFLLEPNKTCFSPIHVLYIKVKFVYVVEPSISVTFSEEKKFGIKFRW